MIDVVCGFPVVRFRVVLDPIIFPATMLSDFHVTHIARSR